MSKPAFSVLLPSTRFCPIPCQQVLLDSRNGFLWKWPLRVESQASLESKTSRCLESGGGNKPRSFPRDGDPSPWAKVTAGTSQARERNPKHWSRLEMGFKAISVFKCYWPETAQQLNRTVAPRKRGESTPSAAAAGPALPAAPRGGCLLPSRKSREREKQLERKKKHKRFRP